MDKTKFELLEEDTVVEIVNRDYWEEKANKKMLKIVDTVISHLDDLKEDYNLNHNKNYIGIKKKWCSQEFREI
ncbi:hypothetical protein [Psychroflexus sp. MES1-P1E]|uniref:hypothetical protein n=1 Tax=Psychroflexus sp. MES1-P1E TaxID=2058320 RepID=UPI0011AE6B40|nr:hypothetical protein [Psychroflexus sp. MES1-P1E]